jgi:hypothetical protein
MAQKNGLRGKRVDAERGQARRLKLEARKRAQGVPLEVPRVRRFRGRGGGRR